MVPPARLLFVEAGTMRTRPKDLGTRILALDLSLTANGWATSLDDHGVTSCPNGLRGVERLYWYHVWLGGLLADVDVVAIEGYAYGASRAGVRGVAEWGGIARLTIHRAGLPYVEIPPSTLKKYATGKGNAKKPDMRMELYKRTQLDLEDDNEVDAVWLLAASCEGYGEPLWAMPKVNVAALEKVEWPVVLGETVGERERR